jgi:hypothetical protein
LEEEVGPSAITGEMDLLFVLLLCGVEKLMSKVLLWSLGWGSGSNSP